MSAVDFSSRQKPKRDYSLVGQSTRWAIETGLASAEWYHSDVPRKTMKALMQRSDGPAIRDTILWIALILGSAAGGIYFWGSWWCVPFFLVYGVLYGSSSNSRWHECGHGTAFRTRWMNDFVYEIASFMLMRNPVAWRWSHARHHTDTIIVGPRRRDRDHAAAGPSEGWARFHRPARFPLFAADAVPSGVRGLSAEEKSYIPETEWRKAVFAARWHVAIYIGAVVAALAMRSFLPLMLIGLPRIYGSWHMVMTGLLQHIGLAEDVTDHRLNTRTVYINPVSRWIYWNMNYHIEHHMFPMVPYHALPQLHELIKHDLPEPNPSYGTPIGRSGRCFLSSSDMRTTISGANCRRPRGPIASEFHNFTLPAAAE